ncbi:MAG: carotenoid biosynthesis protein [Candidatus Methylacidiphilales bacterium]|nr:carotenoid biosynthesis protein [Candidatus Methylacidiphilales bacterium]
MISRIRQSLHGHWHNFLRLSPEDRFSEAVWWIFLIWSTVGLFIMAAGVTEQTVLALDLGPTLQPAALACLHWGDFLFLLFGAIVVWTTASGVLPRRDAWKAVWVVAVGSGLVETIGTLTGFPFGSYTYLGRMGPQIGPLPLAIPAAWWMVVAGFYLTFRRLLPHAGRRSLCLLTASAATAFDWVMEPFAWQVRGYWQWHDGRVPAENYAAWFVLSFLLARLAPLHSPVGWKTDLRAAGVLALTLMLFVVGRLAAA